MRIYIRGAITGTEDFMERFLDAIVVIDGPETGKYWLYSEVEEDEIH